MAGRGRAVVKAALCPPRPEAQPALDLRLDAVRRRGRTRGLRAESPGPCKRAAVFVDRIFRGARPADISIEQPTVFQLRINLRTAKALGLTIPPAVLARADEVIK